ncbi:MAG: hypothetical protein KKH41_02670 [Candidatus Thermoplasmatota archaeon]|nr:hypothetical protein [Candidatus Thermoplasmatota archaeon]MBU4070571.1 hypothetical protein [Candidatus Thermoplasmatota archaeon]MBU4144724.1 hypothetical protein [Candidatus Thermoplasmatota archaeon]MBU4591467.1 hypothetical protein [Candidatus Thermoplasmatota archaeon]
MQKKNVKFESAGTLIVISNKKILLKDIEHSILSHVAVMEAELKVIHDAKGDLLDVGILLKHGFPPSDELKTELAWHVATDLEVSAVFKDIVFKSKPAEAKSPISEKKLPVQNMVHISGHGVDINEIQRILEEHEDVIEARVTGVPDQKKGEVLMADIQLRDGCIPSNELKRDLAWHVQIRIGHTVTFKDIQFDVENIEISEPTQENMVIIDGVEREGNGIHISSHKLSTTEITRTLLKHPDIADAAVVTVPDDKIGEKMKAFLRLKDGVVPSNDLKLELAWYVMTELKPIAVFKNIDLGTPVPELPLESLDKSEQEIIDIGGFTLLSDDVETVLRRHEAVTEAVVIGVPDNVHGEVLEAFVSLIEGTFPSNELKEELAWLARAEIGPEVVFRSIKFRKFLPKADNRKLLRGIIKADALDMTANISISIAD